MVALGDRLGFDIGPLDAVRNGSRYYRRRRWQTAVGRYTLVSREQLLSHRLGMGQSRA